MTTRTTPFRSGEVLTADDLNALAGEWNSWTPVVDQGTSTNITLNSNTSTYLRFGSLVIASARVQMAGAGSAGAVLVSLPVAPKESNLCIGTGAWLDGTTTYRCVAYLNNSTTRVSLIRCDVAQSDLVGNSPNMTLASGDWIRLWLWYEAA